MFVTRRFRPPFRFHLRGSIILWWEKGAAAKVVGRRGVAEIGRWGGDSRAPPHLRFGIFKERRWRRYALQVPSEAAPHARVASTLRNQPAYFHTFNFFFEAICNRSEFFFSFFPLPVATLFPRSPQPIGDIQGRPLRVARVGRGAVRGRRHRSVLRSVWFLRRSSRGVFLSEIGKGWRQHRALMKKKHGSLTCGDVGRSTFSDPQTR